MQRRLRDAGQVGDGARVAVGGRQHLGVRGRRWPPRWAAAHRRGCRTAHPPRSTTSDRRRSGGPGRVAKARITPTPSGGDEGPIRERARHSTGSAPAERAAAANHARTGQHGGGHEADHQDARRSGSGHTRSWTNQVNGMSWTPARHARSRPPARRWCGRDRRRCPARPRCPARARRAAGVARRHAVIGPAARAGRAPGERQHPVASLALVDDRVQPGQPLQRRPRRGQEHLAQVGARRGVKASDQVRWHVRAAGPGLRYHRGDLRAGHHPGDHHGQPVMASSSPGPGSTYRARRIRPGPAVPATGPSSQGSRITPTRSSPDRDCYVAEQSSGDGQAEEQGLRPQSRGQRSRMAASSAIGRNSTPAQMSAEQACQGSPRTARGMPRPRSGRAVGRREPGRPVHGVAGSPGVRTVSRV